LLVAVAAYGVGLVLFISVVWYKWYPALQATLYPALLKWVFKVGLNGLAGFVGYLYAHHYLNTLTGVDPNNFPKTLLAFTVPFAAYVWLLFIGIGAGLVSLGFLFRFLGVIVWNGFVRIGEIPYLAFLLLVVPLCKFVLCVMGQFFMTLPNYAKCRDQLVASLDKPMSDSDQPRWFKEKNIAVRTFFTYLAGPAAIMFLGMYLEQLPKRPPLDRWMHRAASSVLVLADFAHDKTCSVSSETRWIAPLKDRKEQDAPKVLIADLSAWPDIQFSFGACRAQ
jgi:hypothetical protein